MSLDLLRHNFQAMSKFRPFSSKGRILCLDRSLSNFFHHCNQRRPVLLAGGSLQGMEQDKNSTFPIYKFQMWNKNALRLVDWLINVHIGKHATKSINQLKAVHNCSPIYTLLQIFSNFAWYHNSSPMYLKACQKWPIVRNIMGHVEQRHKRNNEWLYLRAQLNRFVSAK